MLFNEMVRCFDKEIEYAKSFDDNSVAVLEGLKGSFIKLYSV